MCPDLSQGERRSGGREPLNRFNLPMYVADYKVLILQHLHRTKQSQKLLIQSLRRTLHHPRCIEETFEVLTFVACGNTCRVPMAESHGYAVAEKFLDPGVRVNEWRFAATSSAQDERLDSRPAKLSLNRPSGCLLGSRRGR